jgi:hypothetical protein
MGNCMLSKLCRQVPPELHREVLVELEKIAEEEAQERERLRWQAKERLLREMEVMQAVGMPGEMAESMLDYLL